MKTLKILIMMVLLCLIVPLLAQERGSDGYSYLASRQCEAKITIRAGDAQYPLTYRLGYHMSKTTTVGTLDVGGTVDLRLPVSRQWYDLTIERAVVDKDLYKVEKSAECANVNTQMAPAPVMTEAQFAAAQTKLVAFLQSLHSR